MITKPLFRKNYLIFVSISLVFIIIALASTWILTSFERDRMFLGPAALNRALLQAFDEDPFKAVEKMNSVSREVGWRKHDLVNDQGLSLITGERVFDKALTPEQRERLEKDSALSLGEAHFPGDRPGILATTHRKGVFLYSAGGPPMGKGPIGPIVLLASLITCVLLSIGVALFYQFSKYRERSIEALAVLQALREGNLSSRLPKKKFDELSPLVEAFNQMAGDVENMVDQLRKADQSRRQLLQDLAHDLRTPLTSLRTFLETLQNAGDKIGEEKRQEVLSLCSSEVQYFAKLVEDLLFLAQITEPKYSLGTERLNLHNKISEQITVFKERNPDLEYTVEFSQSAVEVTGSSRLVERLLRNAYDNSSSFARSKVRAVVAEEADKITVSLLDDGPGFSAKALAEFGQKKASRVVSDFSQGHRISVGIGSVIMKEIAHLHGGTLQAENIYDGRNLILGAKVSFSFTKS